MVSRLPSTSIARSATTPPGLDLLDERVPLLAVLPAEDAFTAGFGVQLDLVGEPLLEAVRIGQRTPDLVRLTRDDDFPRNLHGSLLLQPRGCV